MRPALITIAALLLAPPAPAQTPPPVQLAPEPAAPKLPPVPDLQQRLRALHPSEPMAYFRLAEEVAAEATDPEHQRLARALYILSVAVQRTAATADLTPSVCLGLAALASTPDEARWLRAMADSLTRRDRLEPDWSPPGPEASPEKAALDLATAIGLIRAGEGARAQPLLDDPAVRALLRKHELALRDSGLSITQLRRDMEVWRHCPECFQRGVNQRVISRPNGFILCPTCAGNPGPVITVAQLLGQLRFESLLLDGVNRSWSAQYLVDGGAPLRDLDPAELPGTYGIDPARSFWRDGAWVPDPSAPPPAPEPEPNPSEAPAQDPVPDSTQSDDVAAPEDASEADPASAPPAPDPGD